MAWIVWSDEQVAELIRLAGTVPSAAIAEHFGLKRKQVQHKVTALRLQGRLPRYVRPPPKPPANGEVWDLDRALKLRAAGWRYYSLGALFGIPKSTAEYRIKLALLAQHREERPQRKQRGCLSCREMFMSDGPGHRVCSDCKSSAAWRESPLDHAPAGIRIRG